MTTLGEPDRAATTLPQRPGPPRPRDERGTTRHYVLVSDFDQTLSFNDSGRVLSEMLGIGTFDEKVAGLSRLNLVQEGAELAYLLRHDPEFRRVRREDLIEVGRRIRLKRNIGALVRLLAEGIDGHRFDFYVVSAAPEEVVHSALEGLVARGHILGTQFGYAPGSGEIESIIRVSAGYGKVAAVDELRIALGVPRDRVVYVGDGSSDLHVMLHVNGGDGLTIAVSQTRSITEVAKRTVVSDDALSVIVPVLEEIVGYSAPEIRALLDRSGFVIQEWGKVRTDWLTIREHTAAEDGTAVPAAGDTRSVNVSSVADDD
jgi:2-hydroxy-3-keto-5-methylthiopentenyl-1-phosphate phosphatase